jgi:hypothetical protein
MDSFKFRPKVNALEDRVTPAVTPFEVFQALEQTREAQQQISDILKYFSGPVNVHAQSYFATVLPSIVDESVRSAVVLNEFHAALADQIEASPDAAFFARELVGGTGTHLAFAYSNATQAETAGVGLGAAPYTVRHPAPAPPVVPPVTPPPPPAIPRDESGMTNTVPSLTDPSWVSVGTQGLRVWDVTEGTGPVAQAGQDIVIHYAGWLADNGTVFDSSRPSLKAGASGDPAEFNLGDLIQGWQQGIPGMRAGGIRRLDIPASLGYGERGSPPNIPPNARLVFEIKLFESSDPVQNP